MHAMLDFKNGVTKIKLKKAETENRRLMARLELRGAKFKRESSRFVWCEAQGNIMPIL